MNIDGKNVNDNQRMALLRDEEMHLGLWIEYPSNQLVTARLVRVDSTPVRQMPGEAAEKSAAVPHISDMGSDGSLEALAEAGALAV